MSLFSNVGSEVIDTSTQAGQSKQKLQEDLNQFLNLLVAQLQNQDPLEPLDANEFTAQLVQFASVEQQIQQNSNLEQLLAVNENAQAATMVNYLGTVVEVSGSEFQLLNGQAMMTYTLPAGVKDTTLTIVDASGKSVFSTEGQTDTGMHQVGWDGTNNDAEQLDDGAYKLIVSAKDADGNLMDVSQTVFGYVTATGISDGDVTVSMGDVETDMTNIISVERPVVLNQTDVATE
ncbi:flagellar hook capping FlgD N-terminal domain-containing protein [Magnetovibrio sp. PR-2]|uniref:flagellar hook assembly protein FlgD n=1 Tax=Magnetovibrio sp. PR-2 TaxID=3120356 RepID=UPI002FCDFF02